MDTLKRLIEILGNISQGLYSDDIMELTDSTVDEPVRTISEAVGMMMVKIEAREYQLSLLIKELKELNRQIKNNTVDTLTTIAKILATRDVYTEGHTERVASLAEKIAEHMGLGRENAEKVRIGGLLHDIGKIGFPDILFQSHGEKNPDHLVKEIMSHPKKGYDILKDLDFLGEALEYVYCHHERIDGKGYPRGLCGDQIPLGAKIIAVCDGYDAMTTARPYQKPKSRKEAFEILKKYSGKKWDQDCVSALIKVIENAV